MVNYIKKYLNYPNALNSDSLELVLNKLKSSGTWKKLEDESLWNEIIEEKFKKKFKLPMDEAIKRAKEGDKDALFKLIGFDIGFLFEAWAEGIVLAAWMLGDKEFFEGLAKSIRANKGPFGAVRNPDLLLVLLGLHMGLISEDFKKTLFERLHEEGIFTSADYDYFLKFARRHRARRGQKTAK